MEPHYARWNIAQKLADVLTRNHGCDPRFMKIEEARHPGGDAWVLHFRVFHNFDSLTLNNIFTYWELDPASMLEWRTESWSHEYLIVRVWVLKERAAQALSKKEEANE